MIEDRADALEAERTKARSAIEGRALVSPRREKGLWNFLTWSFFLSLVMSSEAFANASAQAAQNDATVAEPHNAGDAGANAANPARLLDTPAAGEDGAKQALDAQNAKEGQLAQAQAGEHSQFEGLDRLEVDHSRGGEHTSAAGAPAGTHSADGAPTDSGSAGHGPVVVGEEPGSGGLHVDVPLHDIITDVGNLVSNVGDGLTGLVGGVVGSVTGTLHGVVGSLDDIVEHTISPLLETASGVTHLLDNVLGGAASELAGAAGNAVSHLTEPLGQVATPVLNLVGDVVHDLTGAQGDSQGLLGSAGSIVVQPVAAVGHLVDDLFQGGRYSDYNMELQASGDVAGNHVDTSAKVSGAASFVTSLISGDASDDHHGSEHSAPQQMTLPSVLDELGSRLHDGIA